MRRIDGDDYVAASLAAVGLLLDEAAEALSTSGDLADRCIRVAVLIARARMVHNRALGDLEQVTDVPWTAIALGPIADAAAAKPTMDHAGRSAAYSAD